MEEIVPDAGIFQVAQRQAQWLMARQRVIAENVAHAASPGYRAVDVKGFSEALERTSLGMTATSASHFRLADEEARPIGKRYTKAAEVSYSGNNVSLDQQLLAATEVRQGYALNTSVVKALHRLMLSATKG
ncbi:MAG: flagellar basal body rod protein FlgB [Rhodoblastus sp.]